MHMPVETVLLCFVEMIVPLEFCSISADYFEDQEGSKRDLFFAFKTGFCLPLL